jgi:two-component system NtrC family response regulator
MIPPTPRAHHVLAVDDDPAMRALIRVGLELSGYEVTAVGSAKEGLARLHVEPFPELVITDLVMPGGGGLELVRELRERGSTLPVIVLSGEVGPLIQDASSHETGLRFMAKPFEFEELRTTVADALARAPHAASTPT